MNILLINHYAGSKKHGMEYRPYYLAREWVRLGHHVTIAAASQSHVRSQPPGVNGSVTPEVIDGIRYLWFKTPAYHGNGLRRALNIFAFVAQLLRHPRALMQPSVPDAIIASSTHPLDIVPAARLARRAQARLIFEVHDLWPLSLIELGGMPRWHPFIALLQWAEDFAYRRADRVVSMLPKAGEYMRQHGMAASKFAHVPNGIDVQEWDCDDAPLPDEHRQVLADLKRASRFVIGYAGAHGLANALDNVVEAAVLSAAQPVTFVLVGQGPEKVRLQALTDQRHVANVVFLSSVPKAAIPALLDAMDALYIGLKRESLFRFGVSPNKLIDYMMAAKPIIHAIDAGNNLVADSGCGLSIQPENPGALAAAALRLMQMSEAERAALGANGRQYALAHHDYRVLARQFLAIMSCTAAVL